MAVASQLELQPCRLVAQSTHLCPIAWTLKRLCVAGTAREPKAVPTGLDGQERVGAAQVGARVPRLPGLDRRIHEPPGASSFCDRFMLVTDIGLVGKRRGVQQRGEQRHAGRDLYPLQQRPLYQAGRSPDQLIAVLTIMCFVLQRRQRTAVMTSLVRRAGCARCTLCLTASRCCQNLTSFRF